MTTNEAALKLARDVVRAKMAEGYLFANPQQAEAVALAAILEVTERAAAFAFDRVDRVIPQNTYSEARQEAHTIATALREMEHLS